MTLATASVWEAVFFAEGFLTASFFGPSGARGAASAAAAVFRRGFLTLGALAAGVSAAGPAEAAGFWGAMASAFVLRFTGRFTLVAGVSGDGAVVGSVIVEKRKGKGGRVSLPPPLGGGPWAWGSPQRAAEAWAIF